MAKSEKEKKVDSPKKSAAKKKKSSQTNSVSRYLRETRGEIKKVTWPTREESWRLTAIVIGVSIAFALFLWVFDTVFSNSLQFVISNIV